MPLQKPWRDLDRTAVASAPDRPGVYELGDPSGTVLAVDHGVLRDELKTVPPTATATAFAGRKHTPSSRLATLPATIATDSSEGFFRDVTCESSVVRIAV